MSSLNVGIVTHNYPPHIGGVEFIAQEEARRLVERGHQVTVWTSELPDGLKIGDTEHQIAVRRLKAAIRVGNMPLLPGLRRALSSGHDVLLVHAPFLFGTELLAFNRILRSGPPLIGMFHSSFVSARASDLWRLPVYQALSETYIKHVAARSLRSISVLCLITEAQASHPDAPVRWLVERGVATVMARYGVDTSLFTPPPGARVDSGLHALWCGRLDQASGPSFKHLRLALDLVSRVPSLRMTVCGDGHLRAKWETEAAQAGVADRVEFIGAVPRTEMPSVFRRCSLLLSTSVGLEGLPMAILEAMASGLPIIAPDMPGIDEAVRDGYEGLLFERGSLDGLERAVRKFRDFSQAERHEMGVRARRRVIEHYSWDKHVDGIETAFRQALDDIA